MALKIKSKKRIDAQPKALALTSKSSKMLVAAIDFGTTFSGYAFSFKHEYSSSPLTIHTNQWSNAGGGGINLKTPSCLLLTPDKKLHSFGYEAKMKYQSLADGGEHGPWYFFWQFKMTLHQEEEINGRYTLKEEGGKELDALTVFSLSIEYMKDHLLAMVHNATQGMSEDDITWVITVPAIWKDSAKKFMRKAAQQAKIAKDKIEIALEPEAASLYCRHLPVARSPETETGVMKLGIGSQYMIVDCGGGTVDITIHEVLENDHLRELHAANGGYWGGTRVNKAFLSTMSALFGPDVFDKFSKTQKGDYLTMLEDFEMKKRMTKEPSEDKHAKKSEPDFDQVTMRIPVSLQKIFQDLRHKELNQEAISAKYQKDFMIVSDKIRIKGSVFRAFFDEALTGIVSHMKQLIDNLKKTPKAIIMVGGFSDSPILQKAIRREFGNKMEVIIPFDASLCIMKGAVLYGHNPRLIKFRESPYTYGVVMTVPFRPCHKKEKKIEIEGQDLCDDIFDKHVELDQTIETGIGQATRTYYPMADNTTIYPIVLYRSTQHNPTYVDEKGCYCVGRFLIESEAGLGKNSQERPLKVKMIFGGTDIKIVATDIDNKEHTADFSFE